MILGVDYLVRLVLISPDVTELARAAIQIQSVQMTVGVTAAPSWLAQHAQAAIRVRVTDTSGSNLQ